MFCANCGKQIPDGENFCGNCGTAVSVNDQPAVATPVRKKASPIVVFGGGFIIVMPVWMLLSSSPTDVGNVVRQIESGAKFEILVTGTQGTLFNGSYMVVEDGSSNSHSVEGVIPISFTVPSARMVSVAFQKQSTDGTLVVDIIRNGAAVKSSKTTAEYGMVTIATQ